MRVRNPLTGQTHEAEWSTESSASSYGQQVLLVDGLAADFWAFEFQKRFRIEGVGDGEDYGVWPGFDADDALQAMFAKAGYGPDDEMQPDLDEWIVTEA